MGRNRLIGYKIKRSLKAGDMVSSTDGIYEAVYEPLHPVEELAEYAYHYAHYRNDTSLMLKIDDLVKEILATPNNQGVSSHYNKHVNNILDKA